MYSLEKTQPCIPRHKCQQALRALYAHCFRRTTQPRVFPVCSSSKDDAHTEREQAQPVALSNDGARKPRPNPEGLRNRLSRFKQLQKVERLGDDVWAGVAAVDRGENDLGTSRRKAALLVGGDLAALLLFIAIGRANHGESLDLESLFKTAAPFLIGWFGAADLQKAFGREAQGGDVAAAAKKAAVVWATGIPVGIGVRTAQRGYLPDVSFVIVTFLVTLVFLVGWRSALAAITAKQVDPKFFPDQRLERFRSTQ